MTSEPAAARRVLLDGSVWALLATNILALAVALEEGWGVRPLMLVYWGQSVVIGIASVFRILALERFSTEGVTLNDEQVEATAAGKRQMAGFFAAHYGFFHLLYFMVVTFLEPRPALDWGWLLACTLAFALNHLWSYRYNRDLDRRGTPNIGALMGIPYLRIVPMHATIVLGAFGGAVGGPLYEGTFVLLLFGGLKILADVGMHLVEHAQLRKDRGAPQARP